MDGECTAKQQNNDSDLSSLNLTITLAFFGMIWSIMSYVFSTKWKCINNQSILKSQLLPFLKPIWDTYGYPFFYTCCCALCIERPADKQKPPFSGAEWKPSQPSATSVKGANGVSVVKSRNGYQSIDTVDSADEQPSVKEANAHQSVNGYQTIDIDGEEKGLANGKGQPDLTSVDETEDCEYGGLLSDKELPKRPLFRSSTIIFMFSLAQILARPLIIAGNIVYLALKLKGDIINEFNEPEGYNFGYATDILLLQETVNLLIVPVTNAIYWACCWRQCRTNNSCRRFLEFLRFSDLQIVILLAPFSNVHLYALGAWWCYLIIGVRLLFYGITFAAAVVAGMRFVCACYCKVFFTCGCDNDVLEIRNLKHLIFEVVFQIVPIFVKINTSSSAIATFMKLGTKGGYAFQSAYATFSLIRSITAIFSLGFSGAMLRWAVLKEEHKLGDSSWLTKLLRFLDKYQPHVHGSFFIDMITYFPLLVLNLILLELISEQSFYCSSNCVAPQ